MLKILLQFDEWLFEQIMLWANPAWLTQAAEFWVKPERYFGLFVFLFLYALWRAPRETLFFTAGLIVLLVINELLTNQLKQWFLRPRPAVAMGIYQQASALAFPSAHSSNSMALAVFFFRYRSYHHWPLGLAWLAITYSLVIGIGRVIANYHFPLDVLAGWLLGILTGNLFWLLYQKIRYSLFTP